LDDEVLTRPHRIPMWLWAQAPVQLTPFLFGFPAALSICYVNKQKNNLMKKLPNYIMRFYY